VIFKPVEPSGRVGNDIASPYEWRLDFILRKLSPRFPTKLLTSTLILQWRNLSNSIMPAMMNGKHATFGPKPGGACKRMGIQLKPKGLFLII
jgi:hypothetical protein